MYLFHLNVSEQLSAVVPVTSSSVTVRQSIYNFKQLLCTSCIVGHPFRCLGRCEHDIGPPAKWGPHPNIASDLRVPGVPQFLAFWAPLKRNGDLLAQSHVGEFSVTESPTAMSGDMSKGLLLLQIRARNIQKPNFRTKILNPNCCI